VFCGVGEGVCDWFGMSSWVGLGVGLVLFVGVGVDEDDCVGFGEGVVDGLMKGLGFGVGVGDEMGVGEGVGFGVGIGENELNCELGGNCRSIQVKFLIKQALQRIVSPLAKNW
jgi:hypothetical protein